MFVASSALAAGESDLTVTVCVYNYAKVSRRVLGGAEREASRVLNAAGIDMIWVEGIAPQAQAELGPAPTEPTREANSDCDAPERGVTVGLRILSGSTPPSKHFRNKMVGFATSGALASVFYQRVVDLAWGAHKDGNEILDILDRNPMFIPLILGDLIAHELGHVLLGSNSHWPAGIMCAKWDGPYLLQALRGHLLFSPEQSALMRVAVARRRAESILP
jgi:hypothetical protein